MAVVEYQRPSWPEMVFRDAQGQVIPYGSRWPGSPPDDAYCRVTNPQRLAPLITVTEALINHLGSEYQVHSTTEGSVTTLDPGPTAAALRFDVDPVGFVVRVTAGPVAEFVFPVCACDACDEAVELLADDLEATVFAAVAGQLRQRVERRCLVIEIGGGRTSSSRSLLKRSERRRIRRLLRDTPDRWDPWPRRT
jgi:hypothetical protein